VALVSAQRVVTEAPTPPLDGATVRVTMSPPELAVDASGVCTAGVVLVVLEFGGGVELVLGIDPLISGADRSLVVDPAPDRTSYLAATMSGCWKSTRSARCRSAVGR